MPTIKTVLRALVFTIILLVLPKGLREWLIWGNIQIGFVPFRAASWVATAILGPFGLGDAPAAFRGILRGYESLVAGSLLPTIARPEGWLARTLSGAAAGMNVAMSASVVPLMRLIVEPILACAVTLPLLWFGVVRWVCWPIYHDVLHRRGPGPQWFVRLRRAYYWFYYGPERWGRRPRQH